MTPTILIDGQTYTPEGWMWILAFALRGIPWALEAASKPEFEIIVKDYLIREHNTKLQAEVDNCLERIEQLRKEFK